MPTTRYCGRCLSTFETDPTGCPNLACGAPRPAEGWGVVLDQGDVLDRRYQVERCLAVGGAGLTYLARELDERGTPIGPRVAIKVLYNARASGPFLRRLSTEAQILQELAHENIVELRGFVHRAGHEPYLVTRFEEGGSLSQHMDRVGAPPPTVAAAILRQILLGLDVAHQRGVVHRDLKPDNVLLASETERDRVPHVRVADFGIAKIAGGMVGDRLTRTGAFVGTPEYAAPEQFEGQNPTPATDVFAAGVLFVYLLTGKPPFAFSHRADIATSYEEMLAQLPLRMPAVPGADLAITTRLQDVVGNMLVLDPARRWTIHQVLASLGPLVEAAGPRAATIETTGVPAPTRTEPQTLPLTKYPPSALGYGSPPQRAVPTQPSAPPAPVVRSFEEVPVPKSIAGQVSGPVDPTPAPSAVPSDAPPAPPSTLDGLEHLLTQPDPGVSVTDAPKPQGLFPGVASGMSPTAGLFADSPPAPPPTLDGVMRPLSLEDALDTQPSELRLEDVDTDDLPTVEDGLPLPLDELPPPTEDAPVPLPVVPPPLSSAPPPMEFPAGPPTLAGPPPPPIGGPPPPPPQDVALNVVVPPLIAGPPPPPPPVAPPPLDVPAPPPLNVALPEPEPPSDDADTVHDDPPPPTWEEPVPTAAPPPLAPVLASSSVVRLPSSETLLPALDALDPAPPVARLSAPPPDPVPEPRPALPPTPVTMGDVPAPPPFVATEPSPIPEPVVVAPAPSSGSRAGGAAGIAGCFGLSVFGVGAVGVGGLAIVAVLLVAFAAATGWLYTGPLSPDPVVVDDHDPARFRNAKPLSDVDEKKVLRTVREAKGELATRCGTGATASARVLVDSTGKLVYAKVDPSGLGKVDPSCVKRILERLKVRNGLGTEGLADISVTF